MEERWYWRLQPAQRSTAVAFACMISIGVMYLHKESGSPADVTIFINLLYLASFAIWVGTQFWVTFVAGLTMLKLLPRHTFGFVQSHLFTKYFFWGTVLSLVTVSAYLIQHPFQSWEGEVKVQGYVLLVIWIITVANYLYLEPMTISTMFDYHRYEKEYGVGDDISPSGTKTTANPKLEKDETYKSLKKRFLVWHGISSTGNLISFAACGFHLWFLARNITI